MLNFEGLPKSRADFEKITSRRSRYEEKYGDMLANRTIEVQRTRPSGEQWDGIGKLRGRVYVHENGYLPESVLDNKGREYDEYDEYDDTVHICASNEQGDVVGYVRILTKGDGTRLLPAEKVFEQQIDEMNIPIFDNVTEVSRLISAGEGLESPLITASLIRAAAHELGRRDKNYSATTLAVVEPFLERYLKDIIGVPVSELIPVTPTPEYGGSNNKLVAIWPTGIVERASELDEEGRRLVVLPDRMGPFFDSMRESHGLGKVALNLSNDLKR